MNMTLLLFTMIAAVDEGVALTHGFDLFAAIQMALAIGSMAGGVFFVLAGALGVLRLPDFFTRLHAAGMTDTLGAELILLGLIIQSGFTILSAKFLMVAFFLFLTSPTATHAIAGAAHHMGIKPYLGKYKAPDPYEDMEDGA